MMVQMIQRYVIENRALSYKDMYLCGLTKKNLTFNMILHEKPALILSGCLLQIQLLSLVSFFLSNS